MTPTASSPQVVDEIRQVSDFREASPRVISQIDAALHPEFTLLLRHRPGENAFTAVAGTAGHVGDTFPATSKLMALMRVLGKPVDCSETTGGWHKACRPRRPASFAGLASSGSTPLPLPREAGGRPRSRPRRSEEPYSSEDQQLLESICGALYVLLEHSAVA